MMWSRSNCAEPPLVHNLRNAAAALLNKHKMSRSLSANVCQCAGAIAPPPPLVHGLGDAAAALRQLSGARAVGKIVAAAAPPAGGPAAEAAPGRWVITGGAGALGTLSARCMSPSLAPGAIPRLNADF